MLMTVDELQEFKKGIKEVVRKPSSFSSSVLDLVRKMVSQGAEPVKVKIDTLVALASLRLFSKASFEVFEEKKDAVSLETSIPSFTREIRNQ